MRYKQLHTALALAIGVSLLLGAAARADILVETYFAGPDRVYSIDYKDDLLTIGADVGLYVVSDGQIRHYCVADGLPGNRIRHALILDGETLYLGVLQPMEGREQSFYRAHIDGNLVEAENITPEQGFRHCDAMVALAPDGTLWVGDQRGLHAFDGSSWTTLEWPEPFWAYGGRWPLAIDQDSAVWGIEYIPAPHIFRLKDGEKTIFDDLPHASSVAADSHGNVWATNREPPGLWKFDGIRWEIMSANPVWGREDVAKSMALEIQDDGTVWGIGDCFLSRWNDQTLWQTDEACGLPFTGRWDPSYFGCAKAVSDSLLLLGSLSQGLITYDGSSFERLYSCQMPGNAVRRFGESADGAIWLETIHSYQLGRLKDEHWQQLYAPWLQYYTEWTTFATDLEGGIWVSGEECIARFEGTALQLLDSDNSGFDIARCPAIDAVGTIWFCGWWDRRPALSFDGETWEAYSEACPDLDYPTVHEVVVGPGDIKWFENVEGYTSFDGQNWTYYHSEKGLPYKYDSYSWGTHLAFDLEARAIIYGERGLYRGEIGGQWDKLKDDWIQCMALDADGTMWMGTARDGLVHGNVDCWQSLRTDRGLSCDVLTYIIIDHNGDKWVGSEYGLNRIEDGGPAQQKLELSTETTPDGYLAVNGTFTNAGAVIPVLLWLACEYNGSLYHHPTWGPTPEGAKHVLGAYSVETEELLRLDTSTLPPGDYTFYGGISLLGGIDLMIGPRGSKTAIGRYHK